MIYLCYILSGLGIVSYITVLFFIGGDLGLTLAHGGHGAMLTAAIILLLNLSLKLHMSNKRQKTRLADVANLRIMERIK